MTRPVPTIYSTVSSQFINDWLIALRTLYSETQLTSLLERATLSSDTGQPQGRVTLDQIVNLYQLAAVETGDEMMGLWRRPIRPRALQHLLTSVREATTLPSALYRFSTFWNLLLDDYQFELSDTETALVLTLRPQGQSPVQRFGHMLILKLAHGLMSWLAGIRSAGQRGGVCLCAPDFAQDYAIIFPAPVRFGAPCNRHFFDPARLGPVQMRSNADLDLFLQNAPRDWIFTNSREHTQSLRVRAYLSQTGWESANLTAAARDAHDAAHADPQARGGRHIVSGHQGRPAPRYRDPRSAGRSQEHRGHRA
jgi:hypothetical protein